MLYFIILDVYCTDMQNNYNFSRVSPINTFCILQNYCVVYGTVLSLFISMKFSFPLIGFDVGL